MRCLLLLSLTVFALSAGGPGVCAQRNPPMAEQQRDAEKERYYATFNTYRRIPLPDSQRRAYEAAIEYLKLKSFTVSEGFTARDATSSDYPKKLVESFKAAYPLVVFLRHALRG